MDLRKTIATLVTLTCFSLLIVSGSGCSRTPQNETHSGKKIDLTLPKPAARVQIPDKQADKIEVAADKPEATASKNQTEVDASHSTVKADLTKSVSSKASDASESAGKIKKQARKKTNKQRAAVATSQQQRRPVGDGVAVKENQDSPSREAAPLYQQNDNPLHPSYKKK